MNTTPLPAPTSNQFPAPTTQMAALGTDPAVAPIGSTTGSTIPSPIHSRRRLAVAIAIAGATALLGVSASALAGSDSPSRAPDRGDGGNDPAHGDGPSWSLPLPETTVTTTPGVTLPPPSIPETTVPVTTQPVPTVPATNTPAGAIALGGGAFVVPTGAWEVTVEDGPLVTISDGTTNFTVAVLGRPAGEDPSVMMQEYVDTFDSGSDSEFAALSYTPATRTWSTESPMPTVEYRLYYTTFDAAADDGLGLIGGISTYARHDGLTLVTDIWGPASSVGTLPDDIFTPLIDSFLAAPSLGAGAALPTVEEFRVSSLHPAIVTDGVAGFTPAPGFELVSAGEGSALVSSGSTDFEVHTFTGVTSDADALARAQQLVGNGLDEVHYSNEVTQDANGHGVVQHGIAWEIVCGEGDTCGGTIDVFYDPTTAKAYAIMSSWLWAGDTVHEDAELQFMFRSMVDSFDAIV